MEDSENNQESGEAARGDQPVLGQARRLMREEFLKAADANLEKPGVPAGRRVARQICDAFLAGARLPSLEPRMRQTKVP